MLANLHGLLTSGDRPWPRTVVLSGMGGVGKSSLAAEYAHQHITELSVAWRVPAEDPASLTAGIGELAAQLGGREPADVRDPVASAHAVLAAWPTDWLLVFENASDEASLLQFLPHSGSGRIIITSQSQNWPERTVLEVRELDEDVAADYLMSQTGDVDREAAVNLAVRLGGLPLALAQAAAYVGRGGKLADYLGLFLSRQAELLARGEISSHPASVAATLSLARQRLAADAPAAAGLLRLLCVLAPEPVPLRSLLAQSAVALDPLVAGEIGQLAGDRIAFDDAVAALRRYSLITAAGDGMVQMHRITQAVMVSEMFAEQAAAYRRAAAALIEATIPADPALPATWPVCAALLPHARITLELTSEKLGGLTRYLASSGNYPAARDMCRQIADAYEQAAGYGAEHQVTLGVRHLLASYTGSAGDDATARDMLTELLPVSEHALGAEHQVTLGIRHSLASFTGLAGDAAAARDMLTELLPVMERAHGPEHPNTLAARHQLARDTGTAGDAVAGRDMAAALLPVRKRVLGPEHPSTLSTLHLLARFTSEAGDAKAARDMLTELLPVMERALGPEHPNTLAARHSLASSIGRAGDDATARHMLAAVLPVMQRVLGPEHPTALIAAQNLAASSTSAGDPMAVRDEVAALLPAMERVLGPEHPETLEVRVVVACASAWAGDAAAQDMLAALLPVLERVRGPEHPSTLLARSFLAVCVVAAGDPVTARDMLAALLPVMERVRGPEHPDTLFLRQQHAMATGLAGDAEVARDMLAALLPVTERVFGQDHWSTLSAQSYFAHWTGEAGDPAAARDLFAVLLAARQRTRGPDHQATILARRQLASFTAEAGDLEGARDMLAELVPVMERVLGPEDPDTLDARRQLGHYSSRRVRGMRRRRA